MSTSENKEIVRRQWYQELWDNWKISVADDLFTTDYVLHLPGSPPINRDGAKQVVAMFSTAFPDLKHTVDEMISEGNAVAARWTVRARIEARFKESSLPVSRSSYPVRQCTIWRMAGSWKRGSPWTTLTCCSNSAQSLNQAKAARVKA